MHTRSAQLLRYVQLLADLLLLNGSILLAGILRFDDLRVTNEEYFNYYIQLWIFLNLTWILVSQVLKIYEIRPTTEIRTSIWGQIKTLIIQFATLALMLVVLKKFVYSRLFFGYFFAAFTLSGMFFRVVFFNWLRRFLGKPRNARMVILVGGGEVADDFIEQVEAHPEFGLRIHQQVIEGDPNEVRGIEQVEEVYIALPPDDKRIQDWYRFSEQNLLRFRYLPHLGVRNLTNSSMELLGTVPVIYPRKEPLELWHNRLLKRTFDILISILLMVLIFPWFLPMVAIWIKADSRGPVFFRQKRSGINNDTFDCIKLRTMVVNDRADEVQATENDPRITRAGRFLRRHNLDELPQLWNVFLGQMSLVGPRPHMLKHTDEYRRLIDMFMVRHLIPPGLTGLAQSRGLRGEVSDPASMEARVRADVYYLENWSFLLDIKIILVTIWNMVRGRSVGT